MFGGSVAIDATLLAVGAAQEDSDAVDLNGDMHNDDAERSGAIQAFELRSTATDLFADGFEPWAPNRVVIIRASGPVR